MRTPAELVDLTRDLAEAARLASSPDQIDQVVAEALDALGPLVPYDLATVMELGADVLTVRVARGPLVTPAVRRHRLDLRQHPAIREVMSEGRARAFAVHDAAAGDHDPFEGVVPLPDGHFCMVAPLRGPDRTFGLLSLDRVECGQYPVELVELVAVFARLLALAISFGEQSARLERMKRQLDEQVRLLTEETRALDGPRLLEACPSAAMRHLCELARRAAAATVPILITGETGTGKEVLAHAVHAWSPRAAGPFVAINCAALPPPLIESELFGHVRGAFTGASATRLGRFQTANGGTLFLDEIGELPPELQAKLLRVLQDGCFEPVGSDRTVRVDVRVVAATNRALSEQVAAGGFREDLYYRLAVFPLLVPPLRVRSEDIGAIAEGYLAALARRTGGGPWRLSERAVEFLGAQPWPGNVRELVNVLERATILTRDDVIDVAAVRGPETFPLAAVRPCVPATMNSDVFLTLEAQERRHIEHALERCGGRVHGPGGAAELLSINPSTLRSRMQKLGVRRN
jgi:formate hydrogenlyase transcriptional activator